MLKNVAQTELKKKPRFKVTSDVRSKFIYFILQPLGADMRPEAVLGFWNSEEFEYPILSAMAKDYLTVQVYLQSEHFHLELI